jgi:hypothetical protein
MNSGAMALVAGQREDGWSTQNAPLPESRISKLPKIMEMATLMKIWNFKLIK